MAWVIPIKISSYARFWRLTDATERRGPFLGVWPGSSQASWLRELPRIRGHHLRTLALWTPFSRESETHGIKYSQLDSLRGTENSQVYRKMVAR